MDLGGNGIWELPYITDMGKQVLGGKRQQAWQTCRSCRGPGPCTTMCRSTTTPTTRKASACLPVVRARSARLIRREFIQQKDRIIVIFEGGAHVWREIHMDGRPHPKGASLNPTYFGHSVGHWEGDTLVVDTVGYNERTWLGFNGFFHTDELHTIERISRPNRDTLRYEATIDDPGAYSRPWRMGWNIRWSEGQELQEYICQEENQYMIDLKDDFGQPFFKATKTE